MYGFLFITEKYTYVYPNLFHAVSISECCAVRHLQGVKIDSNAKWYRYFVSTSISASYATGRIVHFVRDFRFRKILGCKILLIYIIIFTLVR